MNAALQAKLDECLQFLADCWVKADACENTARRAGMRGRSDVRREALALAEKILVLRADTVRDLEELGLDVEGARR